MTELLLHEELLVLREREARRKASMAKTRASPDYKDKKREYNKRYYSNKVTKVKELESDLRN